MVRSRRVGDVADDNALRPSLRHDVWWDCGLLFTAALHFIAVVAAGAKG
jgi:hypothetical protein